MDEGDEEEEEGNGERTVLIKGSVQGIKTLIDPCTLIIPMQLQPVGQMN